MGEAHIERERRFLVRSGAWRGAGAATSIEQGYLSTDPARVVRLRVVDGRALLTVKGAAASEGARTEIEFEVPLEGARAILDDPHLCIGARIRKTRTVIRSAGLVWEIDEFHGRNAGLCLAEVEHDGAEPVEEWHARIERERPDWLGDEVTAQHEFANSALTQKPFDEWPPHVRAAVQRGTIG